MFYKDVHMNSSKISYFQFLTVLIFWLTLFTTILAITFGVYTVRKITVIEEEVQLLRKQMDMIYYKNQDTLITEVALNLPEKGVVDTSEELNTFKRLIVETSTSSKRLKRSLTDHKKSNVAINSEEQYEASLRGNSETAHQQQFVSTKRGPHHLVSSSSSFATLPIQNSPLFSYERRGQTFTTYQPRNPHNTMIKIGNYGTTSTTNFTTIQNPYKDTKRRIYHRHHHEPQILNQEQSQTKVNHPLPVVHFSGDASKYILGQHTNYNGNGHLRHLQRTFVDWSESEWVRNLGMNEHFEMSKGQLVIKESGLYFVYAQIYYLDEHDTNGFRVYRNDETFLQCTVMVHSKERIRKGSTCYTAGVEYFNQYDHVSLKDLSDSRYSIFEPGKSFFGLIKLSDMKANY